MVHVDSKSLGGFLTYNLPLLGNQDASCGGDPFCRTLDALPDLSGSQLLPGQGLPGHLVPPLLPSVHLPEQRHQSRHLQRHVSEVPRRLQEAVPLRPPAPGETSILQFGTDLQCHQGHVQWGKSRPLCYRNGGGAQRAHGSVPGHWPPAWWQEDAL